MYLDNVRQQYEALPYPPRDPQDERRRLLEVQIDRLPLINFYCFNGQNTFQGARVLVAGGGTGDSTIYLAEQMRERGGEVVYVDISGASMQVAKERAAQRKLDNIHWRHASIMSLAPESFGEFDYVSCTGVLHHLEDPFAGLQRLKSVLKPKGGMGILVYGKYGRAGVYQMQSLMRLVNAGESSPREKVVNTRRVLAQLPETNWFRHNERFLSDHKTLGDSGLYDLLLHEQDVAYTIADVHALVAAASLHLVEFCDVKMRMAYRPEQYIQDPVLLERISKLDIAAQQGIAELLVGLFTKHIFYLSNHAPSKAALGPLTDVPFFSPAHTYQKLGPEIAKASAARPNQPLSLLHETGFEVRLPLKPQAVAILERIDGVRTWGAIFDAVRAVGFKESDDDLLAAIRPVYDQMSRFDWLLLRDEKVGAFTDTIDLHAQLAAR